MLLEGFAIEKALALARKASHPATKTRKNTRQIERAVMAHPQKYELERTSRPNKSKPQPKQAKNKKRAIKSPPRKVIGQRRSRSLSLLEDLLNFWRNNGVELIDFSNQQPLFRSEFQDFAGFGVVSYALYFLPYSSCCDFDSILHLL